MFLINLFPPKLMCFLSEGQKKQRSYTNSDFSYLLVKQKIFVTMFGRKREETKKGEQHA